MTRTFALHHPLRSILWPTQHRLIAEIILMIAGIALIGLAAQCVIPLKPVPLTFQSIAVIFIGMTYGARLGMLTLFGYLIAGTFGLPVFADMSSGFTPLMGATAGYLVGFVPAAWLGGFLIERGWGKHIFSAFIASLLSATVIFFFGLMVLSHFIGFKQAIALGLLPFVVTEPLKLIAISLIVPRFWKTK